MLSLKFYINYWIVVITHDITSLKECIVLYFLRKLSVGSLAELKCKLSCSLLCHSAVFFIVFKFHVEGLSFNDAQTFHRCWLIINNTVQKQQCFTINYVLLNAIIIFQTFRKVALLGFLTFEAYLWFQFYQFCFILKHQLIMQLLFCSAPEESIFFGLTSSYIFQVLIFQSHICFYSYFIELSGDVKKNSGPKSKPDQSFSFCHWNFNTIAMHNFLKIQSLLAYSWIIVGLFVFLKRT